MQNDGVAIVLNDMFISTCKKLDPAASHLTVMAEIARAFEKKAI